VLLLDDHSMGESHLESLAHGVIALERSSPAYGSCRRRLEVVKLRGVKYRDGFHDFSIEHGGLRVFPRLHASGEPTPFERGSLASGVPELDELLGGGIDRGTSTLLLGPAGSGKSALAAQYALAAAACGEKVALYAFDESVGTALTRADSLNMPLREHVESGLVALNEIDPAETSAGELMDAVRRAVDEDGARVVIIDSLTGYLNALPEEHLLLSQLHELLTYLGQRGVVTILIATQHGVIGTSMATPVDVSYLADTVVLLRYFEAGGRVRNAVSVVKKRSGKHERTIREFALGSGGVQIGVPLHEFHGVLTGVPTYTGQSEPLLDVAGARRS
jgi:circadian clock protein KaiC